jgi:L-amino acid N-acyltransferase YncA
MAGRSLAGTPDIPANIGDCIMTLEFLSLSNLTEALDFAELSHKDSAWQDYPFERGTLASNLEKMIGRDNYFTCIYRKEDKIVGYFFASLGSFLFSSVLLGMENGIYIEPEHRGGRVALTMYNAFVAWCVKLGVEPFVEIYFGENDSNQRVYQFFHKVGMIECGKVFRGGKHGLC